MDGWTVVEAVESLDPPLTEDQLRSLIYRAGLVPIAIRRNGRVGRPRCAYDPDAVLAVHASAMRRGTVCMPGRVVF